MSQQNQKLPSVRESSQIQSNSSSAEIAIKTHEAIQRLEALKVQVLERAQKHLDISLYIIREWIK